MSRRMPRPALLRPALLRTMPAFMMLSALAACAQSQAPATPVATSAPPAPVVAQASEPAKPKAPDSLDFYFAPGSSTIRGEDVALLDKASRLYRDGKPIVMIVAGSSDTVGSPDSNLKLSQARANSVLQGLVARGIPPERFQVLAKGVSDLPVQTDSGVANPDNRRVDLTWR
ncbi:OmpA family protein [Lichenicoccus sp.]|uniref:OmpA family protein n=1 Tax=Lichenicoccus sp. TaxID=2781899 RepID=UPI003D0DB41F